MNERSKIISEIQAFASEHAHEVDGRDVVIVKQLIDFLTPVVKQRKVISTQCFHCGRSFSIGSSEVRVANYCSSC